MKNCLYLFLFLTSNLFSQNDYEVTLIDETPQKFQKIIDIDNFGTSYFIQNNIFYKEDSNKTINYSNVQLGEIYSSNAFNPLKINVFYKDFNVAIILDNRLAEIFKIDFNSFEYYKSVSHIATGNDNTIWVFNQDTRQLELFDYKTNKTRALTLPIQSNVIDIASNYNFCWLLTEDYIYKYNYFGSLTQKINNDGFTAIEEDNGNLILQKENTLYYLNKNKEEIVKIRIPELLINQFLVTNETLYIYQFETLSKFQLKNK